MPSMRQRTNRALRQVGPLLHDRAAVLPHPVLQCISIRKVPATFASHRHAYSISVSLADDACCCRVSARSIGRWTRWNCCTSSISSRSFSSQGMAPAGGACRQPAAHVLGCSYIDEDGKLEYNWRKIAKRTLKTLNFWCVHRPWCRSALVCLQVTAVLFVPLFVVAGGRSRGSCSMAPR